MKSVLIALVNKFEKLALGEKVWATNMMKSNNQYLVKVLQSIQ